MLKDFVQDGGRLVILGGCFTVGRGAIQKTHLDDVLPVTFQDPQQVVLRTPPLLLGTGSNRSHDERPAVFGHLRIIPRENSTTLAWAGIEPITVEGKRGKGSAFVFAGTVMGEGDSKHQPFWETNAWSKLLQRMMHGE
jgi:uncharacterized membrane protein